MELFEVIDNYYDSDDELQKSYILNDNFEEIIYLNLIRFVDKNIDSYKSKENILRQFNADFNRTTIIYESLIIDNIDKLLKHFDDKVYYKNLKFKYIIMMLCTQSTYATPYKLLMKMYGNDKYILLSNSENRYIHIYYDKYYKNLIIKINGQFILLNKEESNNINIEFNMLIPINKFKTFEINENLFKGDIIFKWKKI